jgi:uncharacterized protein
VRPHPQFQVSPLDSDTLLLAAVTFLFSGFVKGVIGLGMPTISIALLSLGMGLPAAVQIIVVPTLVTNVWQALAGDGLRRLVTRFHALLLSTVVGVWLGYALLFRSHPQAMTAVLGTAIVVYSLSGLLERPLMPRVRREHLASPVVGLTTGVLAGATGNLSMPAIAYLQQLGLPRNDLVQMLGILFTIGTATLGTAIASHGNYEEHLLVVSALAVLPAVAGMLIGQSARGRLSDKLFRRALFVGLLLLGANLVAKGLG